MFALYRKLIGARMEQAFRADGPAHHKTKGRVPTGTGIVMVILLFLAGLAVAIFRRPDTPSESLGIYVCWAAALMGLLGWVDDYRKVFFRSSEGLKARYKLPVMMLVGLGLLVLLQAYFQQALAAAALTGDPMPWTMSLPWYIYYPLGLFIWVGALNGANFTDGLDGLLSMTTLVVLAGAFYALLDGKEPLAVPAAVGVGVLVAFLIFNWKPALIYMGDTGSLAIGGLVAGLFLAKGWWLFLALCAIVWVIEVTAVVLQVVSFKTTGKRILLMSPLHHHFELAGWGERTTVFVFSLLQLFGCAVAFAWLRFGVSYGVPGTIVLVLIIVGLVIAFRKRKR
jgi:phospho-N-acetylmuramoyl-pentapeptide-transferase